MCPERRWQNVPERMNYFWQVLDRGVDLFADLWSLPHAAEAAARIEKLSPNDLRAVALSQVNYMHTSRDMDAGDAWELEGAEVRSWLERDEPPRS